MMGSKLCHEAVLRFTRHTPSSLSSMQSCLLWLLVLATRPARPARPAAECDEKISAKGTSIYPCNLTIQGRVTLLLKLLQYS